MALSRHHSPRLVCVRAMACTICIIVMICMMLISNDVQACIHGVIAAPQPVWSVCVPWHAPSASL
eukprot:1142644-Pelagomonas_calceolata.AAC.2